MKILHLVHNYYPSPGGPQYSIKHLSEKLIEYYDDETEVATSDSFYGPHHAMYKKISPRFEIINKVKIFRMPFRRWHFGLIKFTGKVFGKITGKALPLSIRKLRYGFDSPALIKFLNHSNADVVMGTTCINNFAEYPLWRFKTKKPKPFILYGAIHIHEDGAIGEMELTKINCCDCYIANTQYEMDQLIQAGVDADKIKAIGTAVDVNDFIVDEKNIFNFKKQYGIVEDDIVIGYTGSIKIGKGVGILVDAFMKLYAVNAKVKLLVCGSYTSYSDELGQLAKEKNLPIIIINNFNETEKVLCFHAMDIFVLPSASESFGVVFLEAWASKKPVIGSSIGAVKSLISDGTDGLIFEKKNSDSLFTALQKLTDDKNLRTALGNNGYKKAVEKYNWPLIVKLYREAYLFAIHRFTKTYKA